MMRKVQRVLDPDIEAQGWEKIRSTVEVDLADGTTLVQPADERYRGGPDLPFTRDELFEKFSDCAALLFADRQVERIFETAETVEELPHIRALVAELAKTSKVDA
jgi:2-methylcitrate dehydratase PrpD